MKVLVTGSSGFVGRATVPALRALGHQVATFDIADGQDLTDRGEVMEFASFGPDAILHLAAIARFAEADADPLLALNVNVRGTENVVALARRTGARLVHASTGSVYMPVERVPIVETDPIRGNSTYGVTKAMAELYVRQSPRWIMLRYAHLYGVGKVGHGLIGGVLKAIEEGRHPQLLGGGQTNDFTYIDDIVAANIAALDAPDDAWNEAYNIGTGVELSATEACQMICDVVGYHGPVDILPARSVDPQRFAYDVTKAARLLGWRARVSFIDGLADMLEERAA